MGLLRTYTVKEAAEFMLYVVEKDTEETLYRLWMHSDMSENFDTFMKKRSIPKLRKKTAPNISEKDEKDRVEFAMQYVKEKRKNGG
jgi:hypothetical protein